MAERIPIDSEFMSMECIRDVIEEDQDCYMCQLNTEPMKKQMGCVTVLVPPDIDQEVTSGDMTVTEGGNVTLNCVAKGQPT